MILPRGGVSILIDGVDVSDIAQSSRRFACLRAEFVRKMGGTRCLCRRGAVTVGLEHGGQENG